MPSEIRDNQGVQLARRGFLRLISALPAFAVFRSLPVQAAPVSEAPRKAKSRKRTLDEYPVALTDRLGREFELRTVRHLGRSPLVPVAVIAAGKPLAHRKPVYAEFEYVGQRPDGVIVARHVSGPEYWKASL